MNLKHDEDWLKRNIYTDLHDGKADAESIKDDCHCYLEHMHRFHPADEWHDELGDVLWYKLPVAESPYVGSPLDVGWYDEPVHILSKGETNAEYYTHFQHIYTPNH